MAEYFHADLPMRLSTDCVSASSPELSSRLILLGWCSLVRIPRVESRNRDMLRQPRLTCVRCNKKSQLKIYTWFDRRRLTVIFTSQINSYKSPIQFQSGCEIGQKNDKIYSGPKWAPSSVLEFQLGPYTVC